MKRGLGASAVLVALALLAYAGRGPTGFLFDDQYAVRANPVVNGSRPLTSVWTHDFWGQGPAHTVGTYRPVTDLSLALDWRVGHGVAWFFRLTSILWHLLVVLATFHVWRRLIGDRLAFGGAAVVAVLAAPSEAVLTSVGRADVLCALWATVGLWAHRQRGWPAVVLATLCFGLALASKESGIMAPAAWLALDVLLPVEGPRWRRLAAYALPIGPYLYGRKLAMGVLYAPWTSKPLFNPLLAASHVDRLFGAAKVFLTHYLRGIIDPWHRLYDCSAQACGPATPGDALAWIGLLLAGALFASPLLLRRRNPVAAAGLAWAALFFLPASNFLIQGPTIYGERLLYAPAIGLGVALMAALDSVRRPALIWGTWALIVGANIVAVRDRQTAWNDGRALLASGLRLAPDSAVVQLDVAVDAMVRRDYPVAEQAARRSIALYPDTMGPHRELAGALFAMGRLDEAGPEFERAYALGRDATLINDYANYLARRGELKAALGMVDDFQRTHSGRTELTALRVKLTHAIERSRATPASAPGQTSAAAPARGDRAPPPAPAAAVPGTSSPAP